MLQCLVGHYRSQVGATDANVNHVPNPFAGVTFPFAGPHPGGEVPHPVQDGMDFGYHVFAVHQDGEISRCAQGRVQHGSLLREVDFFPTKHSVDSFLQARSIGQSNQQPESFIRNAVLRVVEIQAKCLSRQALAAFRIICKELS